MYISVPMKAPAIRTTTIGALAAIACACSTTGAGRSGMAIDARPSLSYEQYQEAGFDPAPPVDE
jgi:hypothetical protein